MLCLNANRLMTLLTAVAVLSLAAASEAYAGERRVRESETWAQYNISFDIFTSDGFTPVYLKVYNVGGQPMFDSIFERLDNTDWDVRHGMSKSDYLQRNADLLSDGFRRVSGNSYKIGNRIYYCAVWLRDNN